MRYSTSDIRHPTFDILRRGRNRAVRGRVAAFMLDYIFGMPFRLHPTVPAPPSLPNPSGRIEALEHRLDALELACGGLWRLLKQRHGYTDEELKAAIHAVDSSDGVMDGKINRRAGVCPKCHHKVLSRTSSKCLWCGGDLGLPPLDSGR